jgi:nucleotide-binding universal stress UspA family protein
MMQPHRGTTNQEANVPTTIRTIVTGIANLTEPDAFLADAVALARRVGAVLHVVHAYRVPEFLATFPVYEPMYQDLTGNYALELQSRLERVLYAAAPDLALVAHVAAGAPGRAICEVANEVDADAIVVGRTRSGSFARALLGTTAERVLREATRPVLLLGQPLPTDTARVLMATDLSDHAAAVHERGLDIAETLFAGATLETEALLVVAFGVVPPPLPNTALVNAGETELEAYLARRRPRTPPLRPKVRLGSTPDCIVAEARGWSADLLVMGTHGRSRFQRYFLGSVAEAVLRAAPCNVLVLPPDAVLDEEPATAPAQDSAPLAVAG